MQETKSTSLHLEEQQAIIRGVAGAGVPQTPGMDELDGDVFGAFSSITLEHDGES